MLNCNSQNPVAQPGLALATRAETVWRAGRRQRSAATVEKVASGSGGRCGSWELYRRCENNPRLLSDLAEFNPLMFWPHYPLPRRSEPTLPLCDRSADPGSPNAITISLFTQVAPRSLSRFYEAVYFNIREKLKYKDYIVNTVFRESASRGLQDRECDLLWKMAGYFHGPRVLDALICGFASPTWVTRAEDVAACFQDLAVNTIKQKAAIAAFAVPIDSTTHMNLINSFVKFTDIERNSDSAGQASDQILKNIDAMLKALPFGVGSTPKTISSRIRRWHSSTTSRRN